MRSALTVSSLDREIEAGIVERALAEARLDPCAVFDAASGVAWLCPPPRHRIASRADRSGHGSAKRFRDRTLLRPAHSGDLAYRDRGNKLGADRAAGLGGASRLPDLMGRTYDVALTIRLIRVRHDPPATAPSDQPQPPGPQSSARDQATDHRGPTCEIAIRTESRGQYEDAKEHEEHQSADYRQDRPEHYASCAFHTRRIRRQRLRFTSLDSGRRVAVWQRVRATATLGADLVRVGRSHHSS